MLLPLEEGEIQRGRVRQDLARDAHVHLVAESLRGVASRDLADADHQEQERGQGQPGQHRLEARAARLDQLLHVGYESTGQHRQPRRNDGGDQHARAQRDGQAGCRQQQYGGGYPRPAP